MKSGGVSPVGNASDNKLAKSGNSDYFWFRRDRFGDSTTMSYFPKAVQELRTTASPDYEQRIEDICRDLDSETIKEDSWPATFFPELLKLLSDEAFLSVRTSWHLLYFIKNNWKFVSPSQTTAFKKILVATFDKFGDWMGAFVGSEILGEFYPDEDTLEILKKLSKSANFPARELVPHLFESLARATQDQELRGKTIQELESLLNDASEAIRGEAAIALKHLGVPNNEP